MPERFLTALGHMNSKIGLICLLISFEALQAQSLKSVLTLDFINIEKKENFQYLESSLTDAVREKLKQNFAFKDITSDIYQPVADQNYIYRKDFYTETAATNLGLLAKGDIVIAGGFRIVETKRNTEIRISVLLIDTAQKKNIAEFSEKAPADATIFETVEKIATRITKEAAAVLPSKEDFQRKGYPTSQGSPWFGDFSVTLRAGGTMYVQGLAQYFKPEQPAINLNMMVFMPVIWQRFFLQADFTFLRHSLKEGSDSPVQLLQLSGVTTNYMLMGYLGVSLPLSGRISLLPKVGGGYIMQTTQVTGNFTGNLNNGFVAFGGGADLLFSLNKNLDVSLGLVSLAELERSAFTYVLQGMLGIRFRI